MPDYISKVVFGNTTLIDLTDDTVVASADIPNDIINKKQTDGFGNAYHGIGTYATQ